MSMYFFLYRKHGETLRYIALMENSAIFSNDIYAMLKMYDNISSDGTSEGTKLSRRIDVQRSGKQFAEFSFPRLQTERKTPVHTYTFTRPQNC
jgi:hypothetical protein